jgi:flagella basal body P-ring formation protein FlgA
MSRVIVIALVLALAAVAGATPPGQATGVAAEVAAQVAAALPAELVLTDVSVPASLARKHGTVAVAFKGALKPGRASVQVTVSEGGQATRGWVVLEIKSLVPVLVARRALAVDDVLAAGDVSVEPRPVASGEALELLPAAVAGGKLTAAVAAGEVVPAKALALPPPVARGAQVRVLVRRGAVTVATTGVLERSARPGERAGVRVEPSHKLIDGRLIDERTVLAEGN